MRRIKLVLEYDGTDFVGWQIQHNGRSVQETVQDAFESFLHQKLSVVGAGRTDSGVHARGQVAHVSLDSDLPCAKLHAALNALLPNDVVVIGVEDVDESFHARYNARERWYSYTISTQPTAIHRRIQWHVQYALDFDLMKYCSHLIAGEHDFRAFTKSEAEVNHYRCTVTSAEWTRFVSRLRFDIRANRFLHGMVRSLVGTMIEIGRGYYPPEHMEKLLTSGNRDEAGQTAPAVGLVLEKVTYE